jgi:RNA polymerase sigma factor (sigma-70 family)
MHPLFFLHSLSYATVRRLRKSLPEGRRSNTFRKNKFPKPGTFLDVIMPVPDETNPEVPRGAAQFATTLWTVVLNAGELASPHAQAALEKLCKAYWYPLYWFVRRQGHDVDAAHDLTQAFFYYLIEKNAIQAADRNRGRFRTFLLTALKRFMANEWHRSQRQKRGGGAILFSLDGMDAEERYSREPADQQTPEAIFDRHWAQALVEQVMARLRAEFVESGQAQRFDLLNAFLLDDDAGSQAEAAEKLGMTESALKSALHRMRQRYHQMFRTEIGNTVASPADVDDEIRELFAVLGG